MHLDAEALAFWLGFWIAFIGLPNYALTARKFIYGPLAGCSLPGAEVTRRRQRRCCKRATMSGRLGDMKSFQCLSATETHYWCDLSESGLSESDLTNITDCSTT